MSLTAVLRRLMKDWAAFCANPEIREGSVISMQASGGVLERLAKAR